MLAVYVVGIFPVVWFFGESGGLAYFLGYFVVLCGRAVWEKYRR